MPDRRPAPAQKPGSSAKPRPFARFEELRAWFARHSSRESELWIRFFKVGSDRPSVTYPEALDEALAFGWIDGVRKRLDDESYLQRFTPRRPSSYWSAVNIRKAEALIAAGRMTPAGLAAFARHDASAARRYSFENRPQDLPLDARAVLKANAAAWASWEKHPPGYRRLATWYVVSAKREDTRARRLAELVERLARGERLRQITSPGSENRARKKRR
jgi:uncharacterized protein YdeI (YjbR/CyaY-like superfamily)